MKDISRFWEHGRVAHVFKLLSLTKLWMPRSCVLRKGGQLSGIALIYNKRSARGDRGWFPDLVKRETLWQAQGRSLGTPR